MNGKKFNALPVTLNWNKIEIKSSAFNIKLNEKEIKSSAFNLNLKHRFANWN